MKTQITIADEKKKAEQKKVKKSNKMSKRKTLSLEMTCKQQSSRRTRK